MIPRPKVAIVGAGSLAAGLAPILRESGYTITQIISRNSRDSRARKLAARIGARTTPLSSAALDASLFWFCVPDREIRTAAAAVASRAQGKIKYAFHSSGALASRELATLRSRGVAVASVHPLMTFVPGAQPPLEGVPFALEGDAPAIRIARRIVRDLGGESFLLPASRKAAYHAWATLTSPLLLAFLVTLEEAGRTAGLKKQNSRRMSLPIIRQTLANYSALGPERSFSGPIIRGDAATVAKHLAALGKTSGAREVYIALARAALRELPATNRSELLRLLR